MHILRWVLLVVHRKIAVATIAEFTILRIAGKCSNSRCIGCRRIGCIGYINGSHAVDGRRITGPPAWFWLEPDTKDSIKKIVKAWKLLQTPTKKQKLKL